MISRTGPDALVKQSPRSAPSRKAEVGGMQPVVTSGIIEEFDQNDSYKGHLRHEPHSVISQEPSNTGGKEDTDQQSGIQEIR